MERDRHPSDPGRLQSRLRLQPAARQWQPHWWEAWLAPMPNWLDRLERGAPLPRLLRR